MIQSALVQKAIKAALASEWDNAIEINEQILSQFPQDLDSLNRLARAYFELGEVDRSRKIYKEVLSLDPYNVIASKNLQRFMLIKDSPKSRSRSGVQPKRVTNFIEEPGKTKVVPLVRLAEPAVLATLHAGDCVSLVVKQRGIQVVNDENVYIGRLPDDLAFHLHYFIENGNQYDACVKQVVLQSVYVFIRESARAPQFASRPTFSVVNDNFVMPSPAAADSEKAEFEPSEEEVEEEV